MGYHYIVGCTVLIHCIAIFFLTEPAVAACGAFCSFRSTTTDTGLRFGDSVTAVSFIFNPLPLSVFVKSIISHCDHGSQAEGEGLLDFIFFCE